jgi:hypothetical protein
MASQEDVPLDSIIDSLKGEPPKLLLSALERLTFGRHLTKIATVKQMPFFALLHEDIQKGVRRHGRGRQAEATSKVQLLMLNALAKLHGLEPLQKEGSSWEERKKLYKEVRKRLQASA